MPIELGEPDGIAVDPRGEETSVWQCPHCNQSKVLEYFRWRKRDDIYPGQNVWHKQSWCRDCRANPDGGKQNKALLTVEVT